MRLGWVIVLGGCNSLIGAHEFVAPDAAPRLDAASGKTCLDRWRDGTVRLDAPVALDFGATSGSERDPSISGNELLLAWSTNRAGADYDIWGASRASTALPFTGATVFANLSSTQYDGKITSTPDGLDAIIARATASPLSSDLFEATRLDLMSGFGAFSNSTLLAIDDAANQFDPSLSDDGLNLYYATGSPQVITVASRESRAAPFSVTGTIAGLPNTSDADPDIADGERLLLFSSTRAGGPGGVDMYYATRSMPGNAFGPPELVPDVNGANNDNDPALSRDGCTLYFASDRAAMPLIYRLYVAHVRTD